MTVKFQYLVRLLMLLSFIPGQSVSAQYNSDTLFLDDSRFSKDLEKKVLHAFDLYKGKTILQLQNEVSSVKEGISAKRKIKSSKENAILTAEQLYEQRKRAVMIVGRINNSSGADNEAKADLFATAFVISEDGLCITNRHVFAELLTTHSEKDAINNQKDKSTYFVLSYDGDVYFIDQVQAYSTVNDILIFTIKGAGKKLPYIPLGEALLPAAPVYIIAHPDNNYFYFSQGVVAKNSLVVQPDSTQRQWRMVVSADYAVGSSGGPIMGQSGNLAGIVSTTRNIYADNRSPQMVLKNAISVLAIKNLLN
ncbi:S1 family peptidase [Sphingobacterium spiritivorum]|uniref:S1 family peptidase n=1 Tax=Sphingobacterium spiritivorum TaxID=258 RepID=UPI003DA520E5